MGMKFASVWDGDDSSDGSAPRVAEYGPRLDNDEKARVLGYLQSGRIVLRSQNLLPDPLDLDREPCVPTSFFTDGDWVWDEAMTYFVATYAVSPPMDFLGYLRARDFSRRIPTDEELDKIEAELLG
ncbi:MAG: hypothetical protein KF742_02515 [Cryobacterium sp.]|nr:hypothetical protein [Cryobacterium sp.]